MLLYIALCVGDWNCRLNFVDWNYKEGGEVDRGACGKATAAAAAPASILAFRPPLAATSSGINTRCVSGSWSPAAYHAAAWPSEHLPHLHVRASPSSSTRLQANSWATSHHSQASRIPSSPYNQPWSQQLTSDTHTSLTTPSP